MAWVEQTGQHSWRVRYRRADGTVGSVLGFSSRRSAEAYAGDMESDQRRQVLPSRSTCWPCFVRPPSSCRWVCSRLRRKPLRWRRIWTPTSWWPRRAHAEAIGVRGTCGGRDVTAAGGWGGVATQWRAVGMAPFRGVRVLPRASPGGELRAAAVRVSIRWPTAGIRPCRHVRVSIACPPPAVSASSAACCHRRDAATCRRRGSLRVS